MMTSKKPLVSIIIPTLNRAGLIGETLESVIKQTFQNWECLIIDDGSTDNTEFVVQSFINRSDRFKFMRRPKDVPKGVSSCRNFGKKNSEGELINWFDSDDIMYPTFLEDRLEVFSSNSSVAIVFCAFNYFDEKGLQKRVGNTFYSGKIIKDLADGKVEFGPPSFLICKESLGNIEYDESLTRGEDLDFFFRLFTKRADLNLIHIPAPLFKVRKHSTNSSAINDPSAQKIRSSFKVNSRIAQYFQKTNDSIGFLNYKRKCLFELKKLLVNRKFVWVIDLIRVERIFSSSEKVHLILYLFVYVISGRGSYKFNSLKK